MQEIIQNATRLYSLKSTQKLPKYSRYIYDDLASSPAKLTAIYGSRGIGKTTLLMQLLAGSNLPFDSKLYISADHASLSGVSLFELVAEFAKRGGKLVCVDEVHEARDFEQELKSIYDFLDIKLYFTGSSALHLSSPDFARRYSMYHLLPLSFREFLELKHGVRLERYKLEELLSNHTNIAYEIISSLADQAVLKEFDEFVRVGVYPFYFEDKSKYIDRVNETINTVLHTDLSQLFGIQSDKIETLKKLLITICVSKPLEYSIEKLAKIAGITKPTLYKYIGYLSDAELIRSVSHEAKSFANIRKSDKLYLANCNLFEALCTNSEKGTIRETFFAYCVGGLHAISYPDQGDFLVDEKYLFEVGGKKKSFDQIKGVANSFVISDDIEIGTANRIPLWLFGFLY